MTTADDNPNTPWMFSECQFINIADFLMFKSEKAVRIGMDAS